MATRFFATTLPQLPTNTDPKIEPDLRDVYTAMRNLAAAIGQYGGFEEADEGLQNIGNVLVTAGANKRRVYVPTLEDMPYGSAVDLVDSGGLAARYASALDATRPCKGFNNTVGASVAGTVIEVVLPGGYITSVGGMVPGTRYFLSTSNGLISASPPAVAGQLVEALGFALTSSVFYFFPDTGWYVL